MIGFATRRQHSSLWHAAKRGCLNCNCSNKPRFTNGTLREQPSLRLEVALPEGVSLNAAVRGWVEGLARDLVSFLS
jgi:hypothetical protein